MAETKKQAAASNVPNTDSAKIGTSTLEQADKLLNALGDKVANATGQHETVQKGLKPFYICIMICGKQKAKRSMGSVYSYRVRGRKGVEYQNHTGGERSRRSGGIWGGEGACGQCWR